MTQQHTQHPGMSSMQPASHPSMSPPMGTASGMPATGSQSANAYDRYPTNAYSQGGVAAPYSGGTSQSYDAYGQEQSRPMADNRSGAYGASAGGYPPSSRGAAGGSPTDPYAQAYSSYPDSADAYGQYGHARRSTNRTVGYHPYSRA